MSILQLQLSVTGTNTEEEIHKRLVTLLSYNDYEPKLPIEVFLYLQSLNNLSRSYGPFSRPLKFFDDASMLHATLQYMNFIRPNNTPEMIIAEKYEAEEAAPHFQYLQYYIQFCSKSINSPRVFRLLNYLPSLNRYITYTQDQLREQDLPVPSESRYRSWRAFSIVNGDLEDQDIMRTFFDENDCSSRITYLNLMDKRQKTFLMNGLKLV